MIEWLIVAIFVAVHVFAGHIRGLDRLPRHAGLSFAGGFSVAYVFLHVLPELSEHQQVLAESQNWEWLQHHAYLFSLLGLTVFYGLERWVCARRPDEKDAMEAEPTEAPVSAFWIHVSAFALYNALVGYLLLHRESHAARELVFYGLAMGLHFLVNDFGLRRHHNQTYHRYGRWVLAAAVLLGSGLGLAIETDGVPIAVLFAFLAGGVILNVMKEELPEEQSSRLIPFIVGAAAFAGLAIAS